MRALLAGLTLLAAVATAWAGSSLVGELQAFSTRYHENPKKIDQLKAALEKAAETEPDSDTLLALAHGVSLRRIASIVLTNVLARL